MRDPTSYYTFVNYLHKMGRLAASINREANIPSRREWSAYLTWCASHFEDKVRYGEEIISIEPLTNSGANKSCIDHAMNQATSANPRDSHVRLLRITSRQRSTGKLIVRLTRNITVGVGGSPSVPVQFKHIYPAHPWEQASRIVHSCTFLPSLNAIEPELESTVERRIGRSSPASKTKWPLHFAVIGAGQSSCEMALHLRRTYPAASVKLIFRASALVPSDDSAFVNSAAFDPERTDVFWSAGEEERDEWRKEFKRTNYSVVRSDVLNEVSEQIYNQEIELPQLYPGSDGPVEGRIDVLANTYVETAELVQEGEEEQVKLVLKNLKTADPKQEMTFDAVFMGTGFVRKPASLPFMKPLEPYFPILDPQNAGKRRGELGFSDDDDSRTMTGDDEFAKERTRERARGITRDYRLVAYASDSFQGEGIRHSSTSSPADSTSSSASSSVIDLSRRGSQANSEVTLNNGDHDDRDPDFSGPRFDPNIYSFGGNEVTHGLSDSLLSICAWRAGEVTESILKRLGGNRSVSQTFTGQTLEEAKVAPIRAAAEQQEGKTTLLGPTKRVVPAVKSVYASAQEKLSQLSI